VFTILVQDGTHGDENRATLQEWLSRWTPVSLEAAHQLQPVWSQLSEKVVRFEDSFERSRGRFEALLDDIGLRTPKELNA
jgi:propane monooxygenase small subunit